MNTQKQIFLIVVMMFVFVGGCSAYTIIDPIRAERQADYFDAESVERGALLFANNCRGCHGDRGQGGIGLVLNKDEFKDQNPATLAANQHLIRTTLQCGRVGTAMPPWLDKNGGALTRMQIEHIVNFLTSPANITDPETGENTSQGWIHAVEFSHNLNHETSVVVSGDTLDTIAKAHGIGPQEFAEYNGITVDTPIEHGDVFETPHGTKVEVFASNETVTKLAERFHVGAVIIADLNGIEWQITREGNLEIIDPDAAPPALSEAQEEALPVVPGLVPGETLQLPDNAVYTVRAGDTPTSVAEQHGISVDELRDENPDNANLQDAADDEELEFIRSLILPENASVVVQAGQSTGTVATAHGIDEAALLEVNGLTEDSVVAPGDVLTLPPDTVYLIQVGDSLASVAEAHQITEEELAGLNELEAGAPISPDVILELPPIEAYVIAGQSMEQVATGYANVSADTLASANGAAPSDVLFIGTEMILPDDAWGTAPPSPAPTTAGTVCVQFTVPDSVYQTLPGVGTAFEPERPEEESQEVVIELNSNDFTLTADGEAQTANQGVVLVAPGTTIEFPVIVGLHTVTVNGTNESDTVEPPETFEFTFEEPGTEFAITCDFHPAMKAWVYTTE